jgi:hypothetical protein
MFRSNPKNIEVTPKKIEVTPKMKGKYVSVNRRIRINKKACKIRFNHSFSSPGFLKEPKSNIRLSLVASILSIEDRGQHVDSQLVVLI